MSTIKSSNEHLTINADGSSKDIKFQANGVEKASISSAGAFTSTTIDATKLTGTIPNFTSTGIDDNADATAITIDSSENVGIGTTSPSTLLHIKGATADSGKVIIQSQTLTNNNRAALFMTSQNVNGMTGNVSIECIHPNNQQSDLVMRTGATDATTFGTERMRITTDGRGLSQFTAKVWIKIDGDTNPASIHDSHNVSSVTDNAVAQYTINFSNNMGNNDYCAVAHAHAGAGTNDVSIVQMPVGSRAVGSVGCHIMAALNSATTFTNNQDCDTEILIFGD